MTDAEKDTQASYKQEIRNWLKGEGLSMKWLASWLGKSEGTVKNWFYGGNPITEENVDNIDILRVKYRDDIGYRYMNPGFDPSPKTYNIPKKEDYIAVIDANSASLVAYSLNANIEDVFYNPSLNEGVELSNVVKITNILTNETRKLLRFERKRCEDEGVKFDILSMDQAEASAPSLNSEPTDKYWGVVVRNDFPILYARVAARLAGDLNFSEWVSDVLRSQAELRIDADLNEFLAGDTSRSTPSYEDDDIPF